MLLVVGSTSHAGVLLVMFLAVDVQDLLALQESSVMLLVVGSTSPAGETLGLTFLQ